MESKDVPRDEKDPLVAGALCSSLELIGRYSKDDRETVAAVLGLVFIIVGLILTATVIGALLGIPLAIFGFFIMLRCIF